jgi:Uma2 family endonuclease
MQTSGSLLNHDAAPREDHSVLFDGVTWEDYERLLALRGEKSVPRLTYLEGVLEIMSPSRDHEGIKSLIGRLVEAWCFDHDVEFMPYGSWTLKDRPTQRGAEPDECYIFGGRSRESPQLVIEVEWTWGGLDKLRVYEKLGVDEVWFWRKGIIEVYVHSEGSFVR